MVYFERAEFWHRTGSAIGAPEQRRGGNNGASRPIAYDIASSVGTADALFRFDQRVPEPLMVALSMIMMDELGMVSTTHPKFNLDEPSVGQFLNLYT